jgi:hypothetical protein
MLVVEVQMKLTIEALMVALEVSMHKQIVVMT